jgi:hypothetical protein
MIVRIGVLLFLFHSMSQAYEFREPKPKLGWQAVQSALEYPEVGIRAGLHAAFMVAVQVDSTGIVDSVIVRPYDNWEGTLKAGDSILVWAIINVCRKVQWDPGVEDGKPITTSTFFPVIFVLYPPRTAATSRNLIVKEAVRFQVNRH